MAIYYNYNNVKVLVNDEFIVAESLSFSLNADISENKEMDKKGGFSLVAGNGLRADVTISYFLVGTDPLYSFLGSGFDTMISLKVGELTLTKGYLATYSISAVAHGPVRVSAGITFYEDFSGSFGAETVDNVARDYLSFSDMNLSFAGINATSNITTLNYSINNEINPNYVIGGLTPAEVKLGAKTTSIALDTYNFQEALPYVGKDLNISFTLGAQTYSIFGTLRSKEVGISFGEKIISALSVQSTSYGGVPDIRFIWRDDAGDYTGSAKLELDANNSCYIYGNNLENVTTVYFNNSIPANNFKIINQYNANNDTYTWTDYILAKIPRFARAGPVTVVSSNGEATKNVAIINHTIDVP